YGYRYETRYRTLPNGRRQRYLKQVPDPHERAIMRMILDWRSQDPPWSWQQIHEKINYELKLRTTDGREWDESRIRRACRAEANLQFQEVRHGQDRFQMVGGSAGSIMTLAQACSKPPQVL